MGKKSLKRRYVKLSGVTYKQYLKIVAFVTSIKGSCKQVGYWLYRDSTIRGVGIIEVEGWIPFISVYNYSGRYLVSRKNYNSYEKVYQEFSRLNSPICIAARQALQEVNRENKINDILKIKQNDTKQEL